MPRRIELEPGVYEICKRVLGNFVLVGYVLVNTDSSGQLHELWMLEPGTDLSDDQSTTQVKAKGVDMSPPDPTLTNFKSWLINTAGLSTGTSLDYTAQTVDEY